MNNKTKYKVMVNTQIRSLQTIPFASKDGESIEIHPKTLLNIASKQAKEILNERERKKGNLNYLKNNGEFQTFIRENLGGFFHLIYNDEKVKLLDNADKLRLCRVLSLMTNENILKINKVTYATKKDLQNLLKLSRNIFNKFYNTLLNIGIMKEEENRLVITKDIARKVIGKSKGIDFIRIFNNGIEQIYNNCTSRQHKQLGILIQLLPYVNYHWNMLCHNPEESDPFKIKRLTISEIGKILDYSKEKDLEKELLKYKVNGTPIIAIFKTATGRTIYVNPRIFFKGGQNQFSNLKQLLSDFDNTQI